MTTITDMRSALPFNFSLTISHLSEGLSAEKVLKLKEKSLTLAKKTILSCSGQFFFGLCEHFLVFSGLIFRFVQVYLHYRDGMVNTVGWKISWLILFFLR